MKKSRIIVPAMALIAFTSLASIAGSVAWFTASRQVSIDAGSYAVVKTSTNLQYEITKGIGTEISGDAVTMDGNKLTDGSFNHNTAKFYWPDGTGKAYASACYSTNPAVDGLPLLGVTAAQLERDTIENSKKVYTAVTFNLSFTMQFGAVSGDYGLFLNKTGSNTSRFTVVGGAAPITATGFRMAFIPGTAVRDPSDTPAPVTNTLVFAGLQTSDKCAYVASGGTFHKDYTTAQKYTNDRLVDSAYSTALPDEGAAYSTVQDRADLLGVFKFKASAIVKLNFTVVAWYEGTDEHIVNQTDSLNYQSVAAILVFDAVKLS